MTVLPPPPPYFIYLFFNKRASAAQIVFITVLMFKIAVTDHTWISTGPQRNSRGFHMIKYIFISNVN